jgi:uncharacterized protein (DUF2267 family)
MSRTGLAVFDSTLQVTNGWLNEVMEELGMEDRHRAFQAMRAVLHAIRDRLTVAETADLGAQLPMMLRGMYYEGWNPAVVPNKVRRREDFLSSIRATFRDHPEISPEGVVWAVFKVLERHVSWGDIQDVKQMLPENIRVLCP